MASFGKYEPLVLRMLLSLFPRVVRSLTELIGSIGAKKILHLSKSKLLNGKAVGHGTGLRGGTTTGTGISDVLPRYFRLPVNEIIIKTTNYI